MSFFTSYSLFNENLQLELLSMRKGKLPPKECTVIGKADLINGTIKCTIKCIKIYAGSGGRCFLNTVTIWGENACVYNTTHFRSNSRTHLVFECIQASKLLFSPPTHHHSQTPTQ